MPKNDNMRKKAPLAQIETTGDRPPRPVVLCVLDGWGYREAKENNAIAQANTPVWDRLMQTAPRALLEASAHEVGLPAGQMGNSEVGHMNLGAGRVVMQDLPRIDAAIADGSLAKLPPFRKLVETARAKGATVHLLGLLSPGGVHSHQDHLAAMAKALSDENVSVAIHAFLDGRDTAPKGAERFVRDFEDSIAGAQNARIVTVTGRYFAMDRDKRWERVVQAYDVIVDASAPYHADSARAAVAAAYARGETDEFVLPTVIGDYAGMSDGDALLMGNFRADRAREILTALLDPTFDGFDRKRLPAVSLAVGLTEYSAALNPFMDTLFPPDTLPNVLGAVVAAAGKRQLRIAETEKYAHVTFFLNGGIEDTFEGEDRILIPSPRVATYDLQPEMSAPEVTDRLVEAIEKGLYDLIVVNYANTDMVGHTGILGAAIKAVEAVDACLGRLEKAVLEAGGAMLVTADHGNAEQMRDLATDEPHTAHTHNLVPVLLIGDRAAERSLVDGRLADVAPTILSLMALPQPAEMTGHSLIRPAADASGEKRAESSERLSA